MKKSLLIIIILLNISSVHSQVLISLVFGDDLNSEFVEFGLEGGLNVSTISNIEGADPSLGFNLGFYFDIISKKNPHWMLNSGVIVKSPMGAEKLPVYSLNNAELDGLYQGGYVNREIRYFNVPVLLKYKFDNNIFVKAGPQASLLANAFDEFNKEIDGEKVKYKHKIRDQVHVVDAGVFFGTGYRLMGGNGMNLGIQYYLGLVPVMKGDGPKQYNRSLYVTLGIPIGKGKAAKKAAEKKANEEKGIELLKEQ